LAAQVAQKRSLIANYNTDLAKLVIKGTEAQVTHHAALSQVAQRLRAKIQAFGNQRRTFLVSCLFFSAVWANLAIAYQLPQSTGVRIGACLALNSIALAALVAIIRRRHWRAVFIYGVAYAILLA
jgi:hypothetical protein